MTLSATTRTIDDARAARLLLAWRSGDRLALDVTLEDAMEDQIGTPGLVFALTSFCSGLLDHIDEADAHLRSFLTAVAVERWNGEGGSGS